MTRLTRGFTTYLVLKAVNPPGWWMVMRELKYTARDGSRHVVTVGFCTDLASIPKFFRRVFSVNGLHRQAAVLHDYLYEMQDFPRKKCDQLFYEAMLDLGVPKWKAKAFYYAVRLGGRRAYEG